ncbi:hypothetical protein KUCAC02_022613, partial [Chaenocephalus aceratus]
MYLKKPARLVGLTNQGFVLSSSSLPVISFQANCICIYKWNFILLLSVCSAVLSAEEDYLAQGVDILYQLGLTAQSSRGERTSPPSTTYTTVPSSLNFPASGYGVLLDSNSLYEAPAGSLFSPEIGEEFSVVVSLSSWRANNAFLFSVRDDRDRLQFGIQLLPRRVVVYTAEKASVYFNYNWQDGHQHHFAVGVRARSVSFYADCGAVQQREQTLGRSQTLGDFGGLFTLGRMNSKAAPFNGRVCQLDIYPSAQAAAHYCKYLKTQCRLADTYRLPLPHPGSDIEANDRPSDPLSVSIVGVAASHHTPLKATSTLNVPPGSMVTQHPQMGDQSHISKLDSHALSTISLPQADIPTIATLSRRAVLDLSGTITTTNNVLEKESSPQEDTVVSENSTEEESSSGSLQTPEAKPGLISLVRQSRVTEGLRNNSIPSSKDFRSGPHQTHHLLETHLRANGTTLYRENHVDISEQHDLDGNYDDESQVLRVLLVPPVYLVLPEKEVLGVPLVQMETQDSLDHLGPRVQREIPGCLQARLQKERRVLKVILGLPDCKEYRAYRDLLGKPGLQVTLAGRVQLGHKGFIGPPGVAGPLGPEGEK